MSNAEQVFIGVTGLHGCRDDLVAAMITEGWTVEAVGDVQKLADLAESGHCHVAVAACPDLSELAKEPVRRLTGLYDMSAIFLVPSKQDAAGCPALTGTTSDQVYELNVAAAELISTIKMELESILSERVEQTVMCVDDDEGFLRSLKGLLPTRVRDALPRFRLNFEFFADPQEALAAVEEMDRDQLALVISDQIMPQMSGIELLKQIKALCPQSQSLLLTGQAGLDSAVAAINDRLLDKYVFKPIEEPVAFVTDVGHLVLGHYLHTRARAQRDRTMAQFELIRTISAATSLEKALAVTTEFLHEYILPGQAVVALAEKGELVVRAGLSLPDDLPIGAIVSEDSALQLALQRRQPIAAMDGHSLPAGAAASPILPSTHWVAPLVWGDSALGGIVIGGDGDRKFTRPERMLVSFAADVAAAAIGGFNDRHALETTYLGTMASLVETVEAKDVYTRGHTDRVAELTVSLAEAIGVSGKQLEDIERAAALHDIGKIAVPDAIVNKPGSLDPEEWAVMQDHPVRAEKILRHLRFLNAARMMIRGHHERYDGKGYPDGLAAEEIPLGARILAIADTFDAMTSERSYRKAMTVGEALAEIEANAGKQFDPRLAAAFQKMMNYYDAPEPAIAAIDKSIR